MKTLFKVGDRFNRLIIVSTSHKDSHGRNHFNVLCDCGTNKVVQGSLMSSGNTKSCGCYGSETRRNQRMSKNHSEVTAIILGYKRHAEDRGFAWNLSRESVESIIFKPCVYCGSEPTNVKKTKNSIGNGLPYSGIDRKDSCLGYEDDNIVPCCKICNYAKSNMNIQDFKNWAIRIGKMASTSQWSETLKSL